MARRSFTREFRESAARLVTEQGDSALQAARSLGVHPNSIRDRVHKFAPAPGHAAASLPEGLAALRREIETLRAANTRLLMEREILKKATAFFAREPP